MHACKAKVFDMNLLQSSFFPAVPSASSMQLLAGSDVFMLAALVFT
jgi:hypothetical protein